MKKTLLLILVLSSLNSFSQSYNYIPFPEIHGEWSYMLYDDYGDPDYSYTYNRLLGDTIIGDSTYKKVFEWGMYGSSVATYTGALREHEKVIYFIPDTSSTEFLLYDFNISIGDTLFNPFFNIDEGYDEYMVLEAMDTTWNNGEYFFDNGTLWIDGVGNQHELLNPFHGALVSSDFRIHCMMNDSVFLVSGSNCFLSITESEIPKNEISIFPNPSNSNFTIKIENGLINEIRVIDSSGRTMIREMDINQTQITIDKLPTGSYILKILDGSGRLSIKKLISSP